MKCQKCGVNNANTHVKSIINGEIKEYDLCSECAKKMGYTNVATHFRQEHRQEDAKPVAALIRKLQKQVM